MKQENNDYMKDIGVWMITVVNLKSWFEEEIGQKFEWSDFCEMVNLAENLRIAHTSHHFDHLNANGNDKGVG